jgi:transposase
MEQVKQLDFSGQTIYAGIDVHKKSWKVCLRSRDMELRMFSQEPSAQKLSEHLRRYYPLANYQVVYEAGFCGFGYKREFSMLGIDCIIVHPADVPTTDKDKQRKSDTVDCRKLSKTLSEGALKGIFVPTISQQDDRGIIRLYQQMVKDQTRCKNRIRGWLNFQGIHLQDTEERYWSNNFVRQLQMLELAPSARIYLGMLLQCYQQTRQLVLAATRQLRALSRQEAYRPQISMLRTIPGIGEVTALLVATEIGDINRFKTLDKLCDFVGLVPKVHSSGDHQAVLGMTHRGHKAIREKLIEASWTAIRLDPAMTMAFNDYCKRMKKNSAIIKIAKKLLNRIRFVLKQQQPYITAVAQ